VTPEWGAVFKDGCFQCFFGSSFDRHLRFTTPDAQEALRIFDDIAPALHRFAGQSRPTADEFQAAIDTIVEEMETAS
jgi:hypothetical protein